MLVKSRTRLMVSASPQARTGHHTVVGGGTLVFSRKVTSIIVNLTIFFVVGCFPFIVALSESSSSPTLFTPDLILQSKTPVDETLASKELMTNFAHSQHDARSINLDQLTLSPGTNQSITTTSAATVSKLEDQAKLLVSFESVLETNQLKEKSFVFHQSMFGNVSEPGDSDLASGLCQSNCSGHGDCYNGTCFCEVEYSGGTCQDPNLKFYASFSSVYYIICAVSCIQLILCINSEIARQKPRNISLAFTISTQKALYFFICLGTAIRGFYFSSPTNGTIRWGESLMSAYYPILMSSSSLLVCFWAEVFHLDVSVERSRFLSKSITGFIMFNVVTYSLLLAELVLLIFSNPTDSDKNFFLGIFYSIYAFLMLIVVIAFLIYGVEVYFKVRGAFIQGETCSADASQLQQSRLGLVSLAVLNLITIMFLLSEVFGPMWKNKVPVLSRNYHQIMFRVVEFGMALWFPCVLWNCIKPEQLWSLNPRRILKRRTNFFHIDDNAKFMSKSIAESELLVGTKKSGVGLSSKSLTSSTTPECWICYETMESKPEAGQMIQPCECKGDVSAVHHECLLRWLMESYTRPNCQVFCKVCGVPYRVEHSSKSVWLPAGLTVSHWFKTAAILTVMGFTVGGACLMIKIFEHMYVKMISVGFAILVVYICFRLLGFNMISAYHRAKFSAIKIIGRKITFEEVERSEPTESVAECITEPKHAISNVNKTKVMIEENFYEQAEEEGDEDYYCNLQQSNSTEPIPSLSVKFQGTDDSVYLCCLADCDCPMEHLPMGENTSTITQMTPTGSTTRL